MPAQPWRFASAKGGTFSGGWFPTTPPAWRVGNEIRAPDTLVDASPTRSRTWVRFPPSPLLPESRSGVLAVLAPRPAARPPLALLEFFLGPPNAALPRG